MKYGFLSGSEWIILWYFLFLGNVKKETPNMFASLPGSIIGKISKR